uniref:Cytochrome P450 96A8-1 n=1 Tax=Isatis tinctoria TaxID=161756 RepID=A0A8F0K868_ISATI|nr:cytochrome P450 96A8-1 [Isatis tinctoria]
MASIGLFEAFITSFCFLTFYYVHLKKPYYYLLIQKTLKSYLMQRIFRFKPSVIRRINDLQIIILPLHHYPWNWPVLGMLPGVLVRLHRIYDGFVEVLENSYLTFQFKGPLFAGMEMLVTVDPTNIHHIMSSNFSNYVKGPELKEIFDVYGDAVFNTDSELWKNMRMYSQSMANHHGFQRLSMNTTKRKLKDVLLPLLKQFAEADTVVDLQDVFGRFTFDTTIITITGSDPRSLSTEMPEIDDFAKALEDASEAVFYRHVIPRFMWKLQSWMGFGQEKKMTEAGATIDRVCTKYILDKREEIISQGITHLSKEESVDILTSSIKLDTIKYELLNTSDDKFFRDIILTFVVAGKDAIASALTWFFWLMSQNPKMVTKARQEINACLPRSGSGQEMSPEDPKEFLNKLVYLHGALCEAMRLYPPVPFERKSPVKPDVLPSGHKVEANSNILIPIYALGRMRAIWGEDALEFKPERWVSETGALRHEPSFKFLAFNAGPRTCIGKHLAMNLMKIVAVEILQNFDIKVVEGHKIEPKPGLILLMKHGLRATLAKRCFT